MKKIVNLLAILLLSIVLFYACSKNENNVTPPQPERPKEEISVKGYENITTIDTVKMKPNVIFVKKDIDENFKSIDETQRQITFKEAPSLDKVEVGDVLYSNGSLDNSDGYAIKITSVEKNSGQIAYRYEYAKMEDVFDKLSEQITIGEVKKEEIKIYDSQRYIDNLLSQKNSAATRSSDSFRKSHEIQSFKMTFDEEYLKNIDKRISELKIENKQTSFSYILYDIDNDYETKNDRIELEIVLGHDLSNTRIDFSSASLDFTGTSVLGISAAFKVGAERKNEMKTELIGKKIPIISIPLTAATKVLNVGPSLDLYVVFELSANGEIVLKAGVENIEVNSAIFLTTGWGIENVKSITVSSGYDLNLSLEANAEIKARGGLGLGLLFKLKSFKTLKDKENKPPYCGLFSEVSFDVDGEVKGLVDFLNPENSKASAEIKAGLYWHNYFEYKLDLWRVADLEDKFEVTPMSLMEPVLISTNTPPSAPQLLSPKNQSIQYKMPVFKWEESIDEDKDDIVYDIYVSSKNEEKLKLLKKDLTGTKYSVTNPKKWENGTYKWQVVAKDSNGGETKGEMLTFYLKNIADIAIEKTALIVEEGQNSAVKIIAGSGHYEVVSNNKDKVIATLEKATVSVKGIVEGKAEVMVTDTETKKKQTIQVTVTEKTPDLATDKTEVSLEAGKIATVNITAGSGNYTVASSDKNKATVMEKGGKITITAVAEGTAKITVTDTKTKQTKEIKVTVSPKTPDLAIDKTEITFEVGQTVTVNITAGSGNYTVVSSDSKKATATVKNGKITLKAVAEGTVKITVTDTKTKQTKEIEVTVTVKIPDLTLALEEGELEEGQKGYVEITSGSGNYTLKNSDNTIAIVTLEENKIWVEGLAKGTVQIEVTDVKSGQVKKLKIIIKNTKELNYIEITTSESIGKKIVFFIEAEEEDKEDIYVDINNNGKKDEGENVEWWGTLKEQYILENQTLRIYGNLTLLECGYNQITKLDLSHSSNKLKVLDCHNNKITKLDLSNSTDLTELNCENNKLKTLDCSTNRNLNSLYCSNNELTSLNIAQNTDLKYLSCENNNLESLDVSNNINLDYLDCRDNLDFSCIKVSQQQMEDIAYKYRWMKDDTHTYSTECAGGVLPPPPANQAYIEFKTTISIGDEVIFAVDARDEDKANIWVDLNNNGIRDSEEQIRNFGNYQSLTYYTIGSQNIRIYGNVNSFLSFKNKLIHLDVSNNTSLEILACNNNNFKQLDLSKNIKLEELEYISNNSEKLDVSNNVQLISINCDDNKITQLDISKNVNLESLNCEHNQLAYLDVSKNAKLAYFWSKYNKDLNCIKVNENQLANIPRDWKKDATATYNTDCSGENSEQGTYPEDQKIFVKGGTFKMGSNNGDSNEKPIHNVTVSDFYIGKYEVTNSQYVDFLNAKGNQKEAGVDWVNTGIYSQIEEINGVFKVKKGLENHPVVYITWYGARAYAKWIGGRLPTEAEWEYAARGGNKSKDYKYSGSNNINDVALYRDNSNLHSHPIGTKSSNELGIYDMSGNIYEYCNDWYAPYNNASQTNPRGPSSGSTRIIRGGSYDNYINTCRTTHRYYSAPYNANSYYGFRVAFDK